MADGIGDLLGVGDGGFLVGAIVAVGGSGVRVAARVGASVEADRVQPDRTTRARAAKISVKTDLRYISLLLIGRAHVLSTAQ